MTGYGKSVCELPSKNVTIELRSLNSKQLDLNVKMPYIYKEKEFEVRALIADKIQRGKVELSIFAENIVEQISKEVNKQVFKEYFNQIKPLCEECGISQEDMLTTIMRMPDILNTNNEAPKLDETEWNSILESIKQAISQFDAFRQTEGQALKKDLTGNIATILKNLELLEPFEKQRQERYRLRLMASLEENMPVDKIDMNRYEQEIIYFLEKMDINEEKVRLRQHCAYFVDTINNEEQPGRKLGFIAQEIGREINTIGSKSNDADMQKIVVLMKDDLEKVKEQVLNLL